jgi:hypothetical protein
MSTITVNRSFAPITGVDMTFVMNEFDQPMSRIEAIRPLNSVLRSSRALDRIQQAMSISFPDGFPVLPGDLDTLIHRLFDPHIGKYGSINRIDDLGYDTRAYIQARDIHDSHDVPHLGTSHTYPILTHEHHHERPLSAPGLYGINLPPCSSRNTHWSLAADAHLTSALWHTGPSNKSEHRQPTNPPTLSGLIYGLTGLLCVVSTALVAGTLLYIGVQWLPSVPATLMSSDACAHGLAAPPPLPICPDCGYYYPFHDSSCGDDVEDETDSESEHMYASICGPILTCASMIIARRARIQWMNRCHLCDGDDDFHQISETQRQLHSQNARNAAATARFYRHGGTLRWTPDGEILIRTYAHHDAHDDSDDNDPDDDVAEGEMLCACPTGQCKLPADLPHSIYCDFCFWEPNTPQPQCTCDCDGCIPTVDGVPVVEGSSDPPDPPSPPSPTYSDDEDESDCSGSRGSGDKTNHRARESPFWGMFNRTPNTRAVLTCLLIAFVELTQAAGKDDPKRSAMENFLPGVIRWDGIPYHDFRRIWFVALTVALGSIAQDGWTLLQTARNLDQGSPGNPGTPAQTIQSNNRNQPSALATERAPPFPLR